MTSEDLRQALIRIDGRPYPAYKDIKGRYDFDDFELSVDRIQGDPFAAPSRLSLRIEHASSGIPSDLFANRSRKTGSETYLAKSFASISRKHQQSLGSGKSGLISIDTPWQEILERTCVTIDDSRTTLRFSIGLPANGRRILGRSAANLLCDGLKRIALTVFDFSDSEEIRNYAETNEDADALRKQLEEHRLVAFIADGSILPRATGIDQRPLENATPFESPSTLRVQLQTPNRGTVSGMGIGDGITLIVGGGYHGKSTLLNAIERGVYNHIPGDGRECVVSRSDATKVRAEDGRSVASVDLSPFINNLPGGKDTVAFSTDNASGSTSQAASIIETLETDARCLLIDEDISATNFLIRDERMQELIAADKEPITPFVQRVRPLYDQHGVSTILVLGGSGDYFEPAHRVIAMDNFLPVDLTAQAKALCSNQSASTEARPIKPIEKRTAIASSISPLKSNKAYRANRNRRPPKRHIKARDRRTLEFGTDTIDLSLQSQIVDSSQTRTIGAILDYARGQGYFEEDTLTSALQRVLSEVSQQGLSLLEGNDLAATRLQELSAALNRLRSLRILQPESDD